jgi:hypothetical protein
MIAPELVVDRSDEQTLFRRIAAFEEPARVLLLQGESNHGKTCLLRRLEYNCRSELQPQLRAVAFVDLSALEDHRPVAFAHYVRSLLRTRAQVRLEEFEQLFRSLSGRGAPGAAAGQAGLPASGGKNAVNAPSSNIGGNATVGGTVYRAENMTFNVGAVSPLDPLAEDDLVEAFLVDLARLGASQPVVIMIDHFDSCQGMLREWIENRLVSVCNSDAQLLLVVAGKDVPYHATDDERIAILTVRSLLPADDVREFLVVHGWEGEPLPHEIDAVRLVLEQGKGFDAVLLVLDALRAIRDVMT